MLSRVFRVMRPLVTETFTSYRGWDKLAVHRKELLVSHRQPATGHIQTLFLASFFVKILLLFKKVLTAQLVDELALG